MIFKYLQMEILESRVHVTCPECSEMLHPNDIYRLLCEHHHLLEKYEEFSVRRVLMTDPDTRWCPAPDCRWESFFGKKEKIKPVNLMFLVTPLSLADARRVRN